MNMIISIWWQSYWDWYACYGTSPWSRARYCWCCHLCWVIFNQRGGYKPSIQTEEMLYNILWIQLNILEMKISIMQINHPHNENDLQTSQGSAYRMPTSSILHLFGDDWKSSPRERQQYHRYNRYNRVHCAPNQCFQFFPTAVLLSLLDRSYQY